MNRRRFLELVALHPLLARFAVGEQAQTWSGPKQPDLPTVADAIASARERGKPLLVFIVPRNRREHLQRAADLTALLDHGDDDSLARLALFDLACADVNEIGAALGCKWEGREPLMVRIDAADDAPIPVPIDDAPPIAFVANRPAIRGTNPKFAHEDNLTLVARTEALCELVRDRVAPAEDLPRRADQARAAASEEDRRAIADAAADPASLPLPLVDRCAALVLAAAVQVGARAGAVDRLARALESRLAAAAPARAAWAHHGVCGVRLDPPFAEFSRGAMCGMASETRSTRRFLHFFTKDP